MEGREGRRKEEAGGKRSERKRKIEGSKNGRRKVRRENGSKRKERERKYRKRKGRKGVGRGGGSGETDFLQTPCVLMFIPLRFLSHIFLSSLSVMTLPPLFPIYFYSLLLLSFSSLHPLPFLHSSFLYYPSHVFFFLSTSITFPY